MESNINEKPKNEKEIEDTLRDSFQCYICLSKVVKPKMCKVCKRMGCEECIIKWLQKYSYCGICKTRSRPEDMISIPILDDVATFFINNIDNHPITKDKNDDKKEEEKKEEEDNNLDSNMCKKHKAKLDYYCLQCDKYYCSNCLIYFGEEANKHKNHLIITLLKIDDLGIKKTINELKKMPNTKNTLEDLIGLCELKIRENDIKKSETIKFIDRIKSNYIRRIDDITESLRKIQNELKAQKEKVENAIESIPRGLTNIVNKNDYVQGAKIQKELTNFNFIDENTRNQIIDISKENWLLNIENYETKYLEFDLPYCGQYIEGTEILNTDINIVPDNPCKFIMTYLNNKVHMLFDIEINMPLNSINYPSFFLYLLLKNEKNKKMEFLDFYYRPNQLDKGITINNEMFVDQFLSFFIEGQKVIIKVYITKAYFHE